MSFVILVDRDQRYNEFLLLAFNLYFETPLADLVRNQMKIIIHYSDVVKENRVGGFLGYAPPIEEDSIALWRTANMPLRAVNESIGTNSLKCYRFLILSKINITKIDTATRGINTEPIARQLAVNSRLTIRSFITDKMIEQSLKNRIFRFVGSSKQEVSNHFHGLTLQQNRNLTKSKHHAGQNCRMSGSN